MKKFVSLLLAFSLALCLAACGGSASSAVSGSAASSEAASSEAASSEAAQELSTTDALRIAGLKGPTTMGLVNLLSMEADGTAAMDYDLQLYGAADEIVPLLMKGELDMAAIPANLAATLYQKTNGGIQAVAVNTLGVLYVVEQGDTVQSMADLKGRTILKPECGLLRSLFPSSDPSGSFHSLPSRTHQLPRYSLPQEDAGPSAPQTGRAPPLCHSVFPGSLKPRCLFLPQQR